MTAHKSNALSALSTAKNSGTGWFLRLDHSIVGISLNEFLAGEDIEVTNVEKKSEDTLIQISKDSSHKQRYLKKIIAVLLIAADEYSKYMTETPILEGAANREYYGRSATSIENKSPIEYGTEQGLAALIYGEQGVSSLPIQDIKGEYIDTDNEYMYYYSVEFVK